MNKINRVGIYLRLSKEDEKLGESGSITNQRAILLNYIQEHKWHLEQEYIDDGVSGTTFDRAGFNRMIQDIENKKINVVLTKDTSRLGRDHIEFGYYVEKYFPEHNVRYIAVCDNIDTFYNTNDMLLFKSAYNDMYVKDISNKIRASLNIKKRNGEFVGAYAPYGYKKDPNNKHKLIIDEAAAQVVKRIFQMFVSGISITKIAHILTQEKVAIPSIYKNMNRGLKSSIFGVWNQRTITDILTNPTYMGDLTQGRNKKINYKSKKRIHTTKEEWIIKKKACPAIVEESLFQMAEKIYFSNKNRYKNKKKKENDLLLKGLVFCKDCKHTIGFRSVTSYSQRKGKIAKIYGNCNYYLKHRAEQACTPHSITYSTLEKMVLEEIKSLLSTFDQEKALTQIQQVNKKNPSILNHQKEITRLEQSIANIPNKIDQLYKDKLNGVIDTARYLRISKQLIEEQKKQEEQLAILKKKSYTPKEINPKVWLSNLLKQENLNRLLIVQLIDQILIDEGGHIDIYYKIKNETFESISCNTILK